MASKVEMFVDLGEAIPRGPFSCRDEANAARLREKENGDCTVSVIYPAPSRKEAEKIARERT